MGKFKTIPIFWNMVSLVIGSSIQAQEISVPYQFTSGTTIRSSEMNENFQLCYDKINELLRRVSVLESQAGAANTLTDGLVAYYPFNGNANDESGNGNNGSSENAPILTTDRFGQSNSAYEFDGNDDYIKVQSSNSLKLTTSYTLSAWIYPKDGGAILSKGALKHSAYPEYQFGVDNQQVTDSNIHGLLTTYSWGDQVYNGHKMLSADKAGPANLIANTWHMVTVAFKGNSTIKVYVNAEIKYEENVSVGSIATSDRALLIGAWRDDVKDQNAIDWHLKGKIDDIRIYNRVLSESEIQELYNSEKS